MDYLKPPIRVTGDERNEIRQDDGLDHGRRRRADDQQIATGADDPSFVLSGRSDDGPLRVKSVSAVQKVFGYRADGRLAQVGPDDQPHISCVEFR